MRFNLNNADRVNYNGNAANEVKFNGEVVWGDYDTAETGTEKCLRLDNSLKRKPKKLIIYGDGISVTPNFETPPEISVSASTKINVCGKNLLDVSKITSLGTASSEQFIKNNGDGSITVGNGNKAYNTSYVKFSKCCPNIVAGEKYILTAESTHNDTTQKFLYFPTANWIRWFFGTSRTVTQAMIDSYIAFYSDPKDSDGKFPPIKIWNLQVEKGISDTEYEEYKTVRSVTVPYELSGIKDSNGSITARDRIEVDYEKKTVKIIRCTCKIGGADRFYLEPEKTTDTTFTFRTIKNYIQAESSGGISNMLAEYTADDENTDSEYFKMQKIGIYSSSTQEITWASKVYFTLQKTRFTNSEFSSDEAAQILKDLVIVYPRESSHISTEDITDTECGQALLNLYCNDPCSTVMSDSDIKITYKKMRNS